MKTLCLLSIAFLASASVFADSLPLMRQNQIQQPSSCPEGTLADVYMEIARDSDGNVSSTRFQSYCKNLESISSFDNCSEAGKAKAENEVIKQLRLLGVTEDIKVYTDSSFSNIYSSNMQCTYETLYSFDAIDSTTGKVRIFLGRSIITHEGQKPLPDIFHQQATIR